MALGTIILPTTGTNCNVIAGTTLRDPSPWHPWLLASPMRPFSVSVSSQPGNCCG